MPQVTVSAVLSETPAWTPNCKTPPLTTVPPEYVSEPPSVSVPLPILARPPGPESAPVMVMAKPAVSMVAPPLQSVMGRLAENPLLA